MYYQNLNITLLANGFIIVLLMIMINKNKTIEFLTSGSPINAEAIQAIASLYDSQGTMTVDNLNVTGNLQVDGQITTPGATIGNWQISKSSFINTNFDGDIVANQGNYNFNYSTASTQGTQNGILNFGSVGTPLNVTNENGMTANAINTGNLTINGQLTAETGNIGGWALSSTPSANAQIQTANTLTTQNGYLTFPSTGGNILANVSGSTHGKLLISH